MYLLSLRSNRLIEIPTRRAYSSVRILPGTFSARTLFGDSGFGVSFLAKSFPRNVNVMYFLCDPFLQYAKPTQASLRCRFVWATVHFYTSNVSLHINLSLIYVLLYLFPYDIYI